MNLQFQILVDSFIKSQNHMPLPKHPPIKNLKKSDQVFWANFKNR